MYTVLFSALCILALALLLSTWQVIQVEHFVADASGNQVTDASGATMYLADLLNTVIPKVHFQTLGSAAPMDMTDEDLMRKYIKNDMTKLLKDEILQLRQTVPATVSATVSEAPLTPSLQQGRESGAV
jgi:hypothetical protein